MLLTTLIRQARNTSLRQLSDVEKTDEILVEYINLGVSELYKRFQLVTSEAIVSLVSGKYIYRLDGTDTDVKLANISDEILQIVSAYDESGEIPINKDNDDFSIFTTSYDTIQVPVSTTGTYISLIYRPYPEDILFIDAGDGKATEADIKLPKGLTDCLLNYITYLAFDSTDSNGDAYYNKFELSCKRAEDNGVILSDVFGRNTSEKGFV